MNAMMQSVVEAVAPRLLDFYTNRFALAGPVQHTDTERQVIVAALRCLLTECGNSEEK